MLKISQLTSYFEFFGVKFRASFSLISLSRPCRRFSQTQFLFISELCLRYPNGKSWTCLRPLGKSLQRTMEIRPAIPCLCWLPTFSKMFCGVWSKFSPIWRMQHFRKKSVEVNKVICRVISRCKHLSEAVTKGSSKSPLSCKSSTLTPTIWCQRALGVNWTDC